MYGQSPHLGRFRRLDRAARHATRRQISFEEQRPPSRGLQPQGRPIRPRPPHRAHLPHAPPALRPPSLPRRPNQSEAHDRRRERLQAHRVRLAPPQALPLQLRRRRQLHGGQQQESLLRLVLVVSKLSVFSLACLLACCAHDVSHRHRRHSSYLTDDDLPFLPSFFPQHKSSVLSSSVLFLHLRISSLLLGWRSLLLDYEARLSDDEGGEDRARRGDDARRRRRNDCSLAA
mmetsp:Transcript_12191/g.36741  ORF Transcript_12191/g.36741 Transcript_12191/m.36741 type:complete len:231 (-) Transcript_12191:1099-1791(-)